MTTAAKIKTAKGGGARRTEEVIAAARLGRPREKDGLTKAQERREALRKSANAAGVSTVTPTGIGALDHSAGEIWTERGRASAEGARLPNGKPAPKAKKKETTNHTNDANAKSERVNWIAAFDARILPVAEIESNPWQPRREFAQAELESLAESIKTFGLQQAVTVRAKPGSPGKWQLIAGERRLRATRIAGLGQIMAIVRDVDDREMAELALVENDQRQDLNPIERAVAYARTLKETGATQEALGKRLGRSQAYIANMVRLLELPKEWQARVISREMSSSHAKELLPFIAYPRILKYIAARIKRDGTCGSLKQFQDVLRFSVRGSCRDLDDKWRHDPKTYEKTGTFIPSDEQLARLNVIELTGCSLRPNQRWAYNTKLFDQLQATFARAAVAKMAMGKKGAATARGSKPKKLSPAEQKARAAEMREQFARRLAAWKINWLRWLIWETVRERISHDLVLKLLLFFATADDSIEPSYRRTREDDLAAAVDPSSKPSHAQPWMLLNSGLHVPIPIAAMRLVRSWLEFDEKKGPRTLFPDRHVASLAEDLGVDIQQEWRKQLAGPLSEGYFELHTKEQLDSLAGELGVFVDVGKPKGVIVKQLMAAAETKKKLPAELADGKKTAKARRARR